MKKNEAKKNNKGFSLVELIVVIAIMAVLVGVLAPQFIKYVEKSRESTDIQNLEQIKTAVETYYADVEGTNTFTVKVTTTSTAAGTAVTAGDSKALTEVGINSVALKSSKWGDVTMTYSTSTNAWTIGYANGKAANGPYYDLHTQLGMTKAS